ncbi:hypothetical protein K373_06403 [Streptomyces sp. DvalAA-21]|nr:hypothetical protein SACTE_0984 [Streptomyces sp. SirexAA-E]PZX30200.1 hypothetical protein K373_06403 [Streptomyces sp. DvalAA-21]RAJ26258.1 hypothetical protein K351_06326 [Streptomyces sp. DpondAA-E10]RAJ40208.1 hypothetical protein K352_06319 [Streptomyces sp. DpondAA-A50]SCD84322.1 hypothetical protein GA0115239_10973 [Streptomyces sp. BpilaLS-43]SCE37451.1 hypothetical protein GA0115235_118025 [Streptomyces sp. DpondAA-F4a]SCM13474.1 hypothetical protein SAMN04883147_1093150 [Strepto
MTEAGPRPDAGTDPGTDAAPGLRTWTDAAQGCGADAEANEEKQ